MSPGAHGPVRALALFAHPGHELRPLGLLREHDARIAWLTDASASTGQARIGQSRRGLVALGLQSAADLLPVQDADLYAALLQKDLAYFGQLLARITKWLQTHQPGLLITDTAEGYNPAHDVCHFLTRRAAQLACPEVETRAAPLTNHPHDPAPFAKADCRWLELSAPALEEKRVAFARYGEEAGGMLQDEIAKMEAEFGPDVHAREMLQPVMNCAQYRHRFADAPPFYEVHGKQRRAEGKYQHVLTLHEHVLPVVQWLERAQP